MGEIKDTAAEVYRAFAADGVPASGENKPSKTEIVNLFGLVERQVAGAVAGLKFYATKAALDADTQQPFGALAYVYDDATPANNAVYHYEPGGWVEDTAYYEAVAQVVQPQVDEANAARDIAVAAVEPFIKTVKTAAERLSDGSNYDAVDQHYRWSVGVQAGAGQDIAAGVTVNAVSFDLELSSSVANIQLRVFSRPTDAATYGLKPTAGPDDEVVYAGTKSLAALNLTATGLPLQAMVYPFPSFVTQQGKTYLFEITTYTSQDANAFSGIARNAVIGAGLNQQQRGFFDNAGLIGSSNALAWRLGTLAYSIASSTVESDGLLDTRLRIDAATAAATGLSVTINGTANLDGVSSAFTGALNLAAPATGNVTAEAVTLTPAQGLPTPAAFYNPLGKLAHANVSSVVVRDAGTNAVLTLDTDYRLNPYSGVVSLAATTTNRNVKVDYHWSLCRYDTVCLDAETRVITAVTGVGRTTDSGEFVPALTSSRQVPLFNLRVADAFPIDVTPVWYLDGLTHRDLAASRAADFENQRRALSPILRMAARGETIRVALMGDSIAAQESGTSPNGTPNTAVRDRPQYFADNVGADRIALLPLYNTGDGAGQVHTRASTAWGLIRALEDLGATVEYYNFAMGGTKSSGGSRQADDPTLRTAVWAVNPHLLLTHYGMNETGSDATEPSLRNLFDDAYAHGVLSVLAIGMPRPSPFKPFSMEAVRKTWRATRRAAEFLNTQYGRRGAFFDPARLVDDAYAGAMGVSTFDYGSADRFHHPGIRECAVYAAELHALVAGE